MGMKPILSAMGLLPAVAPVPAGQPLLPEPVIAERFVAAPAALRLAEIARAVQGSGGPTVARPEKHPGCRGARGGDPAGTGGDEQQHSQERASCDRRRHCGSLLAFLYSRACAGATSVSAAFSRR